MANYNPKGPNFHKNNYKPISDRPLGKLARKPISVKLEEDIDQYLRELSQKERVVFLRETITKAVKAKLQKP